MTTLMTDLQQAQARRARMLEEVEAELGREMTPDERLAFMIGWNGGFGDAVARQREMLRGLVDMVGGR